MAALLLAACGTPQANSTSVPPTTVPPSVPPTATPVPPTVTPAPPTIAPTARPTPSPGSVVYETPQRYQVEYIVTVYNPGFDLDELHVYQPRPVEWDGQTDVQVEEVSPPPTDEGIDPVHGNGMYHWCEVSTHRRIG